MVIKRNFDFLDTVEAVYFKVSTDILVNNYWQFLIANCFDAIFCLWRMGFFCTFLHQGKGLNAMNRDWDDFTSDEQVTWSVYHFYPRRSNLDLDIEGAGPNFYFRIFFPLHFKPEAVLIAQQVFRKSVFIILALSVFQLKSRECFSSEICAELPQLAVFPINFLSTPDLT